MNEKENNTPSYYQERKHFSKYLGNTSYYNNIQKNMVELYKHANNAPILELGSALGHTSYTFAEKFDTEVTGIDYRKDVIKNANEYYDHPKLQFVHDDMTERVKHPVEQQFIIMLYSFHHIPDPRNKKQEFLLNLYDNISNGSLICIGETFLPQNMTVEELWELRATEGYASTFWNTLKGIETNKITDTRTRASVSYENEKEAGELVKKRDGEYLVTTEWLTTTAKEIGFNIKLSEPVNCISDYIILLEKK